MKTAARISLFTVTIMVLVAFILLRDLHLIFAVNGWSLPARTITLILVGLTTFGVIQFMTYADHLLRSLYAYPGDPAPGSGWDGPFPHVAIFIPTYNEEPSVVESCVRACTAITYPGASIYLLDDSTDAWKRTAMEEISRRFGLRYVHRDHRRGFKAGAINHALSLLGDEIPYLLVIDADQKVKPAILADLIPILEADPAASFIQTPQFFRSRPGDSISATFSYQQHTYNKHFCRGLYANRTAMLTGSNCIFRVSRLKAIGGMDEACIAEDIATAFAFHVRGHRGIFLDAVYAEGLAPPNFSAYFTQQLRWAYGNTRLLGTILRCLVKNPWSMNSLQWAEFLVTVSIYLFGAANVTFFLLPIATLFFGIPILPVWLPVIFGVVFMVVIAIQVIISVRERQYSVRDLAHSQAILNGLGFVYFRAILYAASGKSLPFIVTPKTASGPDNGPFRAWIAPVILVAAAVLVSMAVGILRLIVGGLDIGRVIPLFWAGYTLLALWSFLEVWRRSGGRVLAEGIE